MNKIEKLRDDILCIIIDCANGQAHNTEETESKLSKLIQAVRDEEFEKHSARLSPDSQATSCNYSNQGHADCSSCPAKGTRYCP